jgi:hypothetical protein
MRLKCTPTSFNMGFTPYYSTGGADATWASHRMLNPSETPCPRSGGEVGENRPAQPGFSKRAESVDPIARPEIQIYRQNVYVR